MLAKYGVHCILAIEINRGGGGWKQVEGHKCSRPYKNRAA